MLCFEVLLNGQTIEICWGKRDEMWSWAFQCGFDLEFVETRDPTHLLIAGEFGLLTKQEISRTIYERQV